MGNSRAMQQVANAALKRIGSGGSAGPFTRGFSIPQSLPNFSNANWQSVANSHGGGTTSYQANLGNTGYALKVYLNDGHNGGLNTAAIVRTGALHYVDAAVGLAGDLTGTIEDDTLNANLARSYLIDSGQCK